MARSNVEVIRPNEGAAPVPQEAWPRQRSDPTIGSTHCLGFARGGHNLDRNGDTLLSSRS
jgi:hypothetical protein